MSSCLVGSGRGSLVGGRGRGRGRERVRCRCWPPLGHRPDDVARLLVGASGLAIGLSIALQGSIQCLLEGSGFTPLEAGLGFAIDWQTAFLGKETLLEQKSEGIRKRLVAFALEDFHHAPLRQFSQPARVAQGDELIVHTVVLAGLRASKNGRYRCPEQCS